MQISKLRLSGFKSFVHPTELLIEPGLTGVVGPNGCGKSNLVEALRWVMGETSSRGLRSSEMDDVIFAGTGARPAHDHADVVVQLRRAGRSLPQFDEEDELELIRRIGRGVGSVYRVNGREIRARDVQLLFADASSGARSAAIVSQGQIGCLVEAKPTDRRRLLEAAAGTAGLQARRHEAELKLRATDANLVRLQDLLAALEEQHRSLRKQARQAARYRELSATYREAEATLLVGRWQMAGVELATTEDAYRRGRVDVAEQTAMVEEARKQRDQAAQALPELRQRDAAMATDLARLGERLSAVIEEQSRLEGRKQQLAERRQQIDQDVAHGHAALGDAGAMRQQLEQECVALGQAAEQSTIELERTAEEERVSREALDVAEAVYRDRLEGVAEIEARRGQLTERKAEIAKRRDEHDATELEIHAALEGLSNVSDNGDALAFESAEKNAAEALEAAEAADVALRRAERLFLSLRHRELASRRQEIEQQRSALDLTGVEKQVAAAQATADTALAARDQARGDAEAAEAQKSDSEAALRKQQTIVERARAEADALTALVEPSTADKGVIDVVEVPSEHAEALAAALGDDLAGSLDPATPVHWRDDHADSAGPALPEGCTPLDQLIRAPSALNRRLAQIGLVEPSAARQLKKALKQGQRLVSRDGGLWRWDGFVRLPGSSGPAVARLRQRSRRRQLEEECARYSADLSVRAGEQAAAESALQEARAVVERTEADLRKATSACEAARDAEAQARTVDAGLGAELAGLEETQSRVERELGEFGAEASAGPDYSLESEPPQITAEDAEETWRVARAEAAASRDNLTVAQVELERCRAADRAATEAQREMELERTRLQTKQTQLQEARAALEQAGQNVEAAGARAEHESEVARADLAQAQQTLDEHRRILTEASTALNRVRERQASEVQRQAALSSELQLWAERAQSNEARLADLAQRRGGLASEIAQLVELPAALDRQRREHETRIAEIEAERAVVGAQLAELDATSGKAQRALDQIEASWVEARETGARLEARLERARSELEEAEGALRAKIPQLPTPLPEAAPDAEQLAALETELARLSQARERLGAVNLRAIDELQELTQRLETLQAEQTELTEAIERLRRAIATLNREGRDRLRAAFTTVEQHFEAIFVRLFGGGRAKLTLTDIEDPLAAGLELAASPPGKKLQSVSLLSGGEKALTAIALIFAVFLTRPAPLCVLDEVDAPLDDANVERLGGLLEELAQATETRFLVITHNPLTMARMDRLYGVTMAERGISELVSVDLRRAAELRATA